LEDTKNVGGEFTIDSFYYRIEYPQESLGQKFWIRNLWTYAR